MKKEQRDYLKDRLGSAGTYFKQTYVDHSKMPLELVKAQRRIEQWAEQQSKAIKKRNTVVRKAYDKVREILMGEDYDVALAAIKKFREEYPEGD